MNPQQLINSDWSHVLSLLPANLDESAKQCGALVRKRKVHEAQTLLRLGLAYSLGALSLRETAAWAQAAEVVDFSDVALRKRLRQAADWFGWLVAYKLQQRSTELAHLPPQGRIRLLDATTVSRTGSAGTDWRLHVGFDLGRLVLDHVELTDAHGGETLTRLPVQPDEIIVADRGYAHRAGIVALHTAGARVVVRLNWQNLPLQDHTGNPVDILNVLRPLGVGAGCDLPVQTVPDPKAHLPAVPGRLVALRKSEAAAQAARDKAKRQASKKGKTLDARTLQACDYIFLFTTVAVQTLSARAILELYRFRWQIEMAFKNLKGILFLDEMAAKDEALCRSFLLLKVLNALLLEDLRSRWASFSPWGYATAPSAEPLAAVSGLAADLADGSGLSPALGGLGSPATAPSALILRHAA